MSKDRIIVAMSGASGAIYGARLLEALKQTDGIEVHLVLSAHARLNAEIEAGLSQKYLEGLADEVHSDRNQAASIASGSFRTRGMIVAPCSMKTLSAIVHSYADNLITRAADVTLKERRPLVLMPRESPLHAGHCKLLYEAAQLGATIAPPMPAFYNQPRTIDDIVNHSVGRVLDLFDLDVGLVERWQGTQRRSD